MLKIHELTLGAYQTNCYLIHDPKSTACCVIDPGYDGDTILAEAERLSLTIEAILLTHGHFDHVGAVGYLAEKTDCRVYLHPEERTMPEMLTAGPLFYTDTYQEGTRLSLAGLDISVLHTPGHTPGSVCLICGDAMFSGDTLFAGSFGRTDLPGGDWATIRGSLNRLASLQTDYAVYPGHGESTTLSHEKRYNPYIR